MSAPPDLLAATAELVGIASPSHGEAALADYFQARLADQPHLEVVRVADNVVARTRLGRSRRVVLAGHLDTVPANGNQVPVIEGDRCRGLGAADMKGGLAVMAALAETLVEPSVDLTFVFYSCEEVDSRHSGLLQIQDQRADLLAGDVAILGEPTGAQVEAGCQGNLRARLVLAGARAHTARPWTGRNAVHRLAPVLEWLERRVERRPVLDGCEYREALQAVAVEGGVAGNVVPDRVELVLNHRYAPDRLAPEAFAALEDELSAWLEPGDGLELETASEGAPPALEDPLLARLVERTGPPRAKLGWTDVSFFWRLGLPATNFGPGDPLLAHTAGEWVERGELERAYSVLGGLLR